MTSVLNVDTIADKAGTGPVGLTKQQAAKCGCSHGGDAVVTKSFNISSTSDQGTGNYDLSYTNNLSDSVGIYSSTRDGTTTIGFTFVETRSASGHTVQSSGHAGSLQDIPCSSIVHGDLA